MMPGKRILKGLLSPLILLGLSLAACQQLGPAIPTQAPDALFTQAAQTIVAELTQTADANPTQPAATEPPAAPTASQVVEPTTAPTATQEAEPTAEATGTAVPTETPAVTVTTQPSLTNTPDPNVVFEDDFSDENDWFTADEDEFTLEYTEDEAYRIRVNLLNAAIWSIRSVDYENVYLEVDAARTGGPENGFYGLVCRHEDEDNYYAFLLSSTGDYGIAKMEDGEFEFLEEGTAAAEVVHTGSATNRVRAECTGSRLALFANGELLVETADDDFERGSVGLVAKTQLREGLEVTFDNFMIIQP